MVKLYDTKKQALESIDRLVSEITDNYSIRLIPKKGYKYKKKIPDSKTYYLEDWISGGNENHLHKITFEIHKDDNKFKLRMETIYRRGTRISGSAYKRDILNPSPGEKKMPYAISQYIDEEGISKESIKSYFYDHFLKYFDNHIISKVTGQNIVILKLNKECDETKIPDTKTISRNHKEFYNYHLLIDIGSIPEYNENFKDWIKKFKDNLGLKEHLILFNPNKEANIDYKSGIRSVYIVDTFEEGVKKLERLRLDKEKKKSKKKKPFWKIFS